MVYKIGIILPQLIIPLADSLNLQPSVYPDPGTYVRNLTKWLDDLGNPFVKIGLDKNGMTSIDWGVYGLPETFLIDHKGMIIHKHVGPIMKKDLEYINKLITNVK